LEYLAEHLMRFLLMKQDCTLMVFIGS
jgi:hypothetical protein